MELILYHGTKQTNILQLASGIRWGGDKNRAARSLSFSLLKNRLDPNLPAAACVNGDHVELLEGGKSKFYGMVALYSIAAIAFGFAVRATLKGYGRQKA